MNAFAGAAKKDSMDFMKWRALQSAHKWDSLKSMKLMGVNRKSTNIGYRRSKSSKIDENRPNVYQDFSATTGSWHTNLISGTTIVASLFRFWQLKKFMSAGFYWPDLIAFCSPAQFRSHATFWGVPEVQATLLERIYNPITAMFTFQLENTKR